MGRSTEKLHPDIKQNLQVCCIVPLKIRITEIFSQKVWEFIFVPLFVDHPVSTKYLSEQYFDEKHFDSHL